MRRLVVLLLVVLAACGRKTRPVAPETVQPDRPGVLVAASTADGVRLTWRRPEKYTSGQRMNDLGSFVIDRSPGEGADLHFTRVGRLDLDDRLRFRKETRMEWVDGQAVAGERYLYRVVAVTLDGYRSAPAGPVAIQFEPKPASRKEHE